MSFFLSPCVIPCLLFVLPSNAKRLSAEQLTSKKRLKGYMKDIKEIRLKGEIILNCDFYESFKFNGHSSLYSFPPFVLLSLPFQLFFYKMSHLMVTLHKYNDCRILPMFSFVSSTKNCLACVLW